MLSCRIVAESDCRTPLVGLLSMGADPTPFIEQAARRAKLELNAVSMGQGQEVHARRLVKQAMAEGQWVLLQNCHLCLSYVDELFLLLSGEAAAGSSSGSGGGGGGAAAASGAGGGGAPAGGSGGAGTPAAGGGTGAAGTVGASGSGGGAAAVGSAEGGVEGGAGGSGATGTGVGAGGAQGGPTSAATEGGSGAVSQGGFHERFRLWVTTEEHKSFPINFLQVAIKFTNEPPEGIKANLHRTYSEVTQDFLDTCVTVHWKVMLYALAFLHCTAQERRKFGPLGWSIPYEYNQSDFNASVQFIQNHLDSLEFKKAQKVSVSLIFFHVLPFVLAYYVSQYV